MAAPATPFVAPVATDPAPEVTLLATPAAPDVTVPKYRDPSEVSVSTALSAPEVTAEECAEWGSARLAAVSRKHEIQTTRFELTGVNASSSRGERLEPNDGSTCDRRSDTSSEAGNVAKDGRGTTDAFRDDTADGVADCRGGRRRRAASQ